MRSQYVEFVGNYFRFCRVKIERDKTIIRRSPKLALLKHFCRHRQYLGLRQAHFSAQTQTPPDTNGRLPRDWSANVVTSRTTETEPTIVLKFNDSRYTFNTGDYTTRALLHYNPIPMRAIFLTRVVSETVGGLGAVIAQMPESVRSLTVVGPPGIRHFVASLRGFIRRALGFSLIEYQPKLRRGNRLDTIYEDENITVSAFPITPLLATDKRSKGRVENMDEEPPGYYGTKTPLGMTADEMREAAIYHMFKNDLPNTQVLQVLLDK